MTKQNFEIKNEKIPYSRSELVFPIFLRSPSGSIISSFVSVFLIKLDFKSNLGNHVSFSI